MRIKEWLTRSLPADVCISLTKYTFRPVLITFDSILATP